MPKPRRLETVHEVLGAIRDEAVRLERGGAIPPIDARLVAKVG